MLPGVVRLGTISLPIFLLLLAAPPVQADNVAGSGTLRSEALSVGTADVGASPSPASQALFGPGGFVGEGRAAAITVNWSRQDRTSVNSPAAPGGLAGVADAPRGTGEQTHDQVRLEFDVAHDGAALGWAEPAWIVSSTGSEEIALRPSRDDVWNVGAQPGTYVGANAPGFHTNLSVTRDQTVLSAHQAMARLEGSGRLYLWGVNVTVIDDRGARQTYRSGEWVDNETGPGGAVGTRHAQFLRIDLDSASLGFHFLAADLQWATPAADLVGVGLSAANVVGSLSAASETVGLQGEDLDIRGSVAVHSSVSGTGAGLDSEVEFRGSAAVDGRPVFDTEPNMVTRLQPLAPPLAAGAAVLVAVGLVWLALDRARRPRDLWLTAAERALERNNPGAARRETRRLLQTHPDDAEAWFVYATGLLQSKDHDRLVREVEPVMHRLGSDRTRGLAFVLALAHARMAAPERAVPWLALASEDPALRHRAGLEPALQRVLEISAAA